MAPDAAPIGVLVMAYGGPNSLDDVEPYLLDVRGGRPTRPELVEEIRERYHLIGGRSPILELTTLQGKALEAALNRNSESRRYQVYVGMRHWRPYIKAAVERMSADGICEAVGIVLAPHYSRMSIGAYQMRAEEARAAVAPDMTITYVQSYHLHPLYLEALADRVREALTHFPADVRHTVPVIFTAHSLPERIQEWDDPYPRQLAETAHALASLLKLSHWRFAYQSAGRTAEPWLGPDAEEVVKELAAAGEPNILICPIGFVSDHVEILYDIDIELQQLARSLGVHLERTVSLNDHPLFIAALADVIYSHSY